MAAPGPAAAPLPDIPLPPSAILDAFRLVAQYECTDASAASPRALAAREHELCKVAGSFAPVAPALAQEEHQRLDKLYRLTTKRDASSWSNVVTLCGQRPVVVPLGILHGGRGAVSRGAKDASESQAIRDIERDAISVNGVVYKGSEAGYAGIVSVIEHAIRHEEGRLLPSASLSPHTISSIAKQLLANGNRTVSGGDAFEAASAVFAPRHESALSMYLDEKRAALRPAKSDWDWEGDTEADIDGGSDAVDEGGAGGEDDSGADEHERSQRAPDSDAGIMLVPASTKALPILLEVDVGPFQPTGTWAGGWMFGIRARVTACTVYKLVDAGAQPVRVNGNQLRVAATYSNHVGWVPGDIAGAAFEAAVRARVPVASELELLQLVLHSRSMEELDAGAAALLQRSEAVRPSSSLLLPVAPSGFVELQAQLVADDADDTLR